LRSALSERVREGNLLVLDEITFDKPKTKDFVQTLGTLGLEGRTLIVDSLDNDNLILAARNIKRAKVVNSYGLNIYDLLYHEKLVVTRAAVEELTGLLDPKSKKAEGEAGASGQENEEAA
jgi:large subunit ribosomal protein L4